MPVRELRAAARAVLAVLAVAALLAGCGSAPPRGTESPPAKGATNVLDVPDPVPREEPRSASGNPPFYEVFGKRYFVLKSAAGFRERGVASWYGPGFHAARTASGERYDMYQMTAAHRTLPLPTYVRVTHLGNSRSIVVRVNDRGPFKDERIIDLSYTAAAKLGMIESGTALVEIEALVPGGKSADSAAGAKAPAENGSPLFVQAGAFSDQDNADRLVARLQSDGVDQAFVRRDVIGDRTLYRVRVGPITDVRAFDRVVAELHALGVPDVRLALD